MLTYVIIVNALSFLIGAGMAILGWMDKNKSDYEGGWLVMALGGVFGFLIAPCLIIVFILSFLGQLPDLLSGNRFK